MVEDPGYRYEVSVVILVSWFFMLDHKSLARISGTSGHLS